MADNSSSNLQEQKFKEGPEQDGKVTVKVAVNKLGDKESEVKAIARHFMLQNDKELLENESCISSTFTKIRFRDVCNIVDKLEPGILLNSPTTAVLGFKKQPKTNNQSSPTHIPAKEAPFQNRINKLN